MEMGSIAGGETGGCVWDTGFTLRSGKKFPVPVVGQLACCGMPVYDNMSTRYMP